MAGIDPMELLSALVGSQTNTNIGQTGSEAGSMNQALTGSTNQSQNGSTNTSANTSVTGNTSGTSSQNTTGTTNTTGTQSQNTSSTGVANQTQNQNMSTQNTADVAALQQILQKQQAGPTGESLAALFSQGAEGLPQVLAAYANSIGARTDNNSGLSLALRDMMTKLTGQAALMQADSLKAAGDTAGKIAQLTSGQVSNGTTTGTTTQSGTQVGTTTSNQSATTNQTQTGAQTQATSQQQNTQQLVQQLMNTLTNQNQNVNQQTGKATNTTTNQQASTNVNDERVLSLLALLGGGSVLNNGLQGAGLGGISGVANTAGQAGSTLIADLLKSIGVTGNTDYWSGGQASSAVTGGTDIDALLAEWAPGSGGGSTFDGSYDPNFWNEYGGA